MIAEASAVKYGRRVLVIVTVDVMAWLLLRPWLEGLRDTGFEVHIACARGKYFDQLAAAGFIMHPVSFRRTFNVFAHFVPFFELVGILRAGHFQIVNTHSPVAAAVGRMAAVFAFADNIIYTVHGFYFHDRMLPILANPIIALEWFLGRWTDSFMFVSDEDRRTAQRLGICGVNARVCTIYNGVDVDLYHPGPDAASDELRASYGLRDRPVVGIVGRIVKEKGYREFLQMAKALTDSGSDATYLVVGDSLPSDRDQFGPEFRASVSAAGLQDRFVFTGMTDRVPEYLRLMDVFVLPSYREGFPRSILEAMAAGLPVVATDIRGCREAVVEGVTGHIVQPRDAEGLRRAVESLLREPERRKRMGEEARRIAIEKYEFGKVRRQFVAFVEAVHRGGPAFLLPQRDAPPILKMAVGWSSFATLLIVFFTLYFVPNLMAGMIAARIHHPWIFIVGGDALGCVFLMFLVGWRWASSLYLLLTAVEAICTERGIWRLNETIWFSNMVPAAVATAWLIPLVTQARNWRRPPAGRGAETPRGR